MKTLIATLMIIVSISLIAYGARPRVSMADSGEWHVKCCDCSCKEETKQEAPKKVGKRKECKKAGNAW